MVTFDGELDEAQAGSAITVTLEDEVDLSRGDVLVAAGGDPAISQSIDSMLVWMHADAIDPQKLYILKHTTRTVRARVTAIRHRVDVNTLQQLSTATLNMNDIAHVELQTTLPLIFDPYRQIPATGSFILIDPITNATVAAGMIQQASGKQGLLAAHSARAVTSRDRLERFAHGSAAIWVEADNQLAENIERLLFDAGCDVHLIEVDSFNEIELAAVARAFHRAGALIIFSAESERSAEQMNAIFTGTFFRANRDNYREVEAEVRHKLHHLPNERGHA